ncbi:MAG: hypothetical protein HAW60_05175 [Bdellovibrionales bacterium]|nr:hypothetical protein [Bdellovibrionales bacterium]
MNFLVFILSFCSVSYQILLSYIIADVSESSHVFVYSLTAGVYFLSLGIGAYIYNTFFSKKELGLLIKIESWLIFLVPIFIFGIYISAIIFSVIVGPWMQSELNLFYYKNILLVFCLQFFVIIIGILSGFELPIFLKISPKTGMIIFLNYVAGLFAGLLLPIFIIPNIDFFGSFLFVSYLNFFILAYLIYYYKVFFVKNILLLVSLSVALFLSASYKDNIFNFYLKTHYFNAELNKNNNIFDLKNIFNKISNIEHFRTKYQSIDVISPYTTRKLPDIFKTFSIFLDKKTQINLLDWRVYHESMVAGSINLFKKNPKKILVLGGGDGLIVSQILKFIPNSQRIDWVELDPKVMQFFKNLSPLNLINKSAFSSKKVYSYIEDAFHFVKNSKNKYDAIFIDFPLPFNQDLSRLYSVEFYKLLAKILSKNSYIVADVLLITKKNYIFPKNFILPQSIFSSTLKDAGFKSVFFYGPEEPFLFAQINKKSLSFNFKKLSKKISTKTKKNLIKLNNNSLGVKIKKEYINSIFKPMSFIP